jgi:hypothetical protein
MIHYWFVLVTLTMRIAGQSSVLIGTDIKLLKYKRRFMGTAVSCYPRHQTGRRNRVQGALTEALLCLAEVG